MGKVFWLGGLITPEQKDHALSIGLNYRTVYTRVVEYGWEIEDAVTMPLSNLDNNRFTEKEKEMLKSNGISFPAAYSRLARGWDRDKAISTPMRKRRTKMEMDNV